MTIEALSRYFSTAITIIEKSRKGKTLQLLEINPHHPSLRLHQFKTRSFEGYSVSINMSYRISLQFIISDQEIILVTIGNHIKIYGKK